MRLNLYVISLCTIRNQTSFSYLFHFSSLLSSSKHAVLWTFWNVIRFFGSSPVISTLHSLLCCLLFVGISLLFSSTFLILPHLSAISSFCLYLPSLFLFLSHLSLPSLSTAPESSACRPDLFDYEARARKTAVQNLSLAFHLAAQEYNVERLLDPEGESPAPLLTSFNHPIICQPLGGLMKPNSLSVFLYQLW